MVRQKNGKKGKKHKASKKYIAIKSEDYSELSSGVEEVSPSGSINDAWEFNRDNGSSIYIDHFGGDSNSELFTDSQITV